MGSTSFETSLHRVDVGRLVAAAMLQNSCERDPMGSTSFEVSEDLAFKVANLEMRVAAWEAAASNTLQVPGVRGSLHRQGLGLHVKKEIRRSRILLLLIFIS